MDDSFSSECAPWPETSEVAERRERNTNAERDVTFCFSVLRSQFNSEDLSRIIMFTKSENVSKSFRAFTRVKIFRRRIEDCEFTHIQLKENCNVEFQPKSNAYQKKRKSCLIQRSGVTAVVNRLLRDFICGKLSFRSTTWTKNEAPASCVDQKKKIRA